MRIEGFNPILLAAKIKEERKTHTAPSPTTDQFSHAIENPTTYSAPNANKDQQLQVKNYVTTILFRQNWAEKSSRFSTQFSRSTAGVEVQDTTYWRPEQVAQRIVSFSKSYGDNTTEKVDLLKKTALESLESTAQMLGGINRTLQITRERIVQEFDAWREEISAS
jgi:hypothetical protein